MYIKKSFRSIFKVKEHILLLKMLLIPFKSHVGFISYRQFYLDDFFLQNNTNKETKKMSHHNLFCFIVFHPAIFNNFHFKI